YARYKRAFPRLFKMTAPPRRASGLHDVLNVTASKKDWPAYDRYRREWDRLTPDHDACECYINDLHTNDGLRAVAAARGNAIPDAVARAANVRGCPHLSTGGLRLDLVRVLVGKKRHLDAVRAYLARAAEFAKSKDLAALRRKLDGVARRT